MSDYAELIVRLKYHSATLDRALMTEAADAITALLSSRDSARREAIEQAALVCESRAGDQSMGAFRVLMSAAKAIRALAQPDSGEKA